MDEVTRIGIVPDLRWEFEVLSRGASFPKAAVGSQDGKTLHICGHRSGSYTAC